MSDVLARAVLRLELTLPDGEVLTGEWTMATSGGAPSPAWFKDPPSWLTDLRKEWEHPQDPVTFKAKVEAGHEDDARAVLA